MNWYRKSHKESQYTVSGLIVACFGKKYRQKLEEYDLVIEELFKGDPWIASAKSKQGCSLSEQDLKDLIEDYQEDPDDKGVPYYFAIKDINDGKEFVIFNDDGIFHPINSEEEKENTKEAGIDKGLVEEQLDF